VLGLNLSLFAGLKEDKKQKLENIKQHCSKDIKRKVFAVFLVFVFVEHRVLVPFWIINHCNKMEKTQQHFFVLHAIMIEHLLLLIFLCFLYMFLTPL